MARAMPGLAEAYSKEPSRLSQAWSAALASWRKGGAERLMGHSEGWQREPYSPDGSPTSIITAFSGMGNAAALSHFQTTTRGLTSSQAARRLKLNGRNALSCKKPMAWWQLLLQVIPNPFNILLALIAVISVANPTPNWSTFIILAVMIVVSCAVRFWQEYRSNAAATKLQSSVTNDVRVQRQSTESFTLAKCPFEEVAIKAETLVPGDILLINPGDSIPADCLLIEGNHLVISQSSLTGESAGVRKTANPQSEKDALDAFALENVVFMGTSVISGSGLALVLRTGDDAIIASITKALNEKPPLNAFQRGIRNVSYMLIGFMLVMVPIVLVVSGKVTHDWRGAALFSVSVAVGLVPEMLPAIVNANLARGAFKLAKRKAIVKRLDSIQNLGAMSVLCSDKVSNQNISTPAISGSWNENIDLLQTGTLTNDEISLSGYLNCEGYTEPEIFRLAYINAVNQSGSKNAVDSAIINFYRIGDAGNSTLTSNEKHHASLIDHKKIAEIPFTFETRRSSCIVKYSTGKHELICKGAFEETLNLCTHIQTNPGTEPIPLGRTQRLALSHLVSNLNTDGYRTILVATRELTASQCAALTADDSAEILPDLTAGLTAHGLLTFLDPPKPDAAASIAKLQALGVEVKVLTGDALGVALQVCRSLNLVKELDEAGIQAISGPDLKRLEGTEEFDEVVRGCVVFAKLTPAQKGQVVLSLKQGGGCVGMLGDGINDSIALKYADVGISVDSGAGVAKDVAEIILTQKELDIIVECVTTGRFTHGNTIKYIKMVASSNFGNVFSILAASAWLPFQPMTGLQILVQNLLYDISQIAIPWDRVDEEYLAAPRRWNARGLPSSHSSLDLFRFILFLGPLSSTIDICTFCLGWFYYDIRTTTDPVQVARFQTHWFLEGLLTQTLIVHLLRTAKIPFFQSRSAPILAFSTICVIGIGIAIPYIPPFQRALGLVQPATSFLGLLAAELLIYCLEVQIVKVGYKWLFGTWL
ncbi:hypothetical protein FGG08_000434 [Glutinoglossum americanum]|uniref:Cation-transporting P-type ATPase N-terminal domain-containing protein n=1 Tax=Glutinoglossum americanum TaxID=1670608 RepID=A0A9P8ID99_9PEZI|nr:hypothetical protein FGG08_000434 [Glutinoglossum americanum]